MPKIKKTNQNISEQETVNKAKAHFASKFDEIDTNKNGKVSPHEMMESMIKSGKLKMGSKTSEDFTHAMVRSKFC